MTTIFMQNNNNKKPKNKGQSGLSVGDVIGFATNGVGVGERVEFGKEVEPG